MGVKCPKCHYENPDDTVFCGKCGGRLHSPEEVKVTETLETPKEELTTGSTFARRYQIIEELGKGGMGKVYRALDKELNEEIALKLIKPEIAQHKKSIERFKSEIRLARKVSHKNIGRVHELMEEKGVRFITMEYVPGEDLKSFIRRSGQLAVGTTIRIAKQVCEGLAEAHKMGIVHRDLKPNNIIIDKEGNARIMDFGIARSLMTKGITDKGVMIGTPEYMSPEQVEGKEVDPRSDIYSLGIILYEMLTGQVPFEGDTPFTIGVKHKSEPPRPPKELNEQIPDELNRVILKCLEKDKADRYQSAEEVRSELEHIEKGIPTTEKVIPKKKTSTSKEITVTFNPKKLWIPVLGVLTLAVLAFMLFRGFWGKGAEINPDRVMVAMFENQTGDKSLNPLGRMASDWITQGLSQTDLAEVVPTMTVLQFSPVTTSESGTSQAQNQPLSLAREIGAGIVISGVYYLADNDLQFHASITDVQHGKLIHSLEPVQGPLDKKMEVIQSLREQVLGSLAVYLDNAWDESYLKQAEIPEYEAYQEFMQGAEFFGVDYPKAIQHFERAVELDPTFIQAKMWIATAYGNQGCYAEAESILQSIDQNRKKLSPFDGHIVDWYKADLEGRHQEALRFIRMAEKLTPKNFTVNYIVGLQALQCNRPQETVETFARLDSVDPEILYRREVGSWRIGVLAEAHHMLGNYKKELKVAREGQNYYPDTLGLKLGEVRALAALERIKGIQAVIEESLTMKITATSPGTVMHEASEELRAQGYKEEALKIANRAVDWYQQHRGEADYRFPLAQAFYLAERLQESRALFEELFKEEPENIDFMGYLGTLAARLGDEEEALRISEELKNIDRPYLFGVHTYWRACIASPLGNNPKAVKLLTEAFNQGLGYGVYLHNNIGLEPLRDYPPFQELIKPKG
jgi:serine/threonine protein kinase/tetratricopeptide (TPR) repeat protein